MSTAFASTLLNRPTNSPSNVDESVPEPTELSLGNRLARRLLLQKLQELNGGNIQLTDSSGSTTLGQGGDLQSNMHVHNPAFFRHAVLGGSLSVAESYLRGDWDCDDLTAFFRIFVRNIEAADQLDRGLSRIAQWVNRMYHRWHANSKSGSRRNIHAHYDLGNEFFRLMLDDTLAYSSGIFLTPSSTLRDASLEKMDRICRKLELRPNDHLLEIGTGWGGLAIHAASQFGCRVTTTTISQQQFDVARERIAEAGLSDRVTLMLQDYRDLTGQFDKLVSVEMIEAVGHRNYDTYFCKCSELLKPDGTFLLQAIVMPDRRYAQYLKSADFIQRYVFPGGCLPSVSAILESMSRVTDLRFVHAEDFGTHYAQTLREWRQRFHQRLDDIRGLGFPDRFIRMWNYYLSYCEAAFDERFTGVVQIQFDKPQCQRDPIAIGSRAAAWRSA
ncbi:MAG: class I SAM-dependent methyltransferase [Planctomycetaceae bacterium]|nr:class I SAM-dependent methyltransferase [Planctomycetaceae bacterium]